MLDETMGETVQTRRKRKEKGKEEGPAWSLNNAGSA
jgi:hypothetical protein